MSTQLMIAHGLLPDWMAQELLWDCDPDTRKDVREYLAKRGENDETSN